MPKSKKLSPISEDLILDRLRFENPWWVTGHIEDDYKRMRERLYTAHFQRLVEEIDVRRAVVLMGPRRVGKTVMLHHSIARLLNIGVDRRKICYVNIENPVYNKIGLERLFALCQKATSDIDPGSWFVYFDEIQYLKDWQVHLKVLVDSYPRTKFIATGSAAATLNLQSKESGAGRFTDFLLPPLTFNEFLFLKNKEDLVIETTKQWSGKDQSFYRALDQGKLNDEFLNYINFGGYPEVVFSEKIQQDPGRYIRNDIVDKVLLRDLPSLYGIQNVQELNSFFTTLAYHSGEVVSIEALSKSSGVNKPLLVKYLEYLESAYLIKRVNRIDLNAKKFRRATEFKVFLTNPSLRSALFSPLNSTDEEMGNMVETTIYAQWLHRDWFIPYYASWGKGEVDMVGLGKTQKPIWALEIKWSDRYFDRPSELKSLISFCRQNDLETAIVTTIQKEGIVEVDGIALDFVPSSTYAFTVGKRTFG
ncbi:MAG: ATP-binding protein [Aridibacter famidurans]|nr:ATP-binding protein [Aridibacter famidurans]